MVDGFRPSSLTHFGGHLIGTTRSRSKSTCPSEGSVRSSRGKRSGSTARTATPRSRSRESLAFVETLRRIGDRSQHRRRRTGRVERPRGGMSSRSPNAEPGAREKRLIPFMTRSLLRARREPSALAVSGSSARRIHITGSGRSAGCSASPDPAPGLMIEPSGASAMKVCAVARCNPALPSAFEPGAEDPRVSQGRGERCRSKARRDDHAQCRHVAAQPPVPNPWRRIGLHPGADLVHANSHLALPTAFGRRHHLLGDLEGLLAIRDCDGPSLADDVGRRDEERPTALYHVRTVIIQEACGADRARRTLTLQSG